MLQEKDIVVVGASAGGVQALRTLVAGLPADLPAALFVVLHTSPSHKSTLPEILTRAGRLPATHPEDGERIERGRIYVAPPNRHLMLEEDRVRVVFGPAENRFRPAMDPLFRSAASVYGPRVAGVVLSGTLSDGCNGLIEIKQRGGLTVVQDPKEAEFPQLPLNVLGRLDVDHILPALGIADLLRTAVPTLVEEKGTRSRMAKNEPEPHFSGLTCPDCDGPIMEVNGGSVLRFQCIVGHAYSPDAMKAEHRKKVENGLWSAMASLQEHAALLRKLAQDAHTVEEGNDGRPLLEEAQMNDKYASEIRDLLERIHSGG